MPEFYPVTIIEFIEQIKFAQKAHVTRNEPIPEINADNIYKVETCLKAPFQTFQSKELYRGFIKKAAILFYLIIKNHPLVNGNKRMAILTLVYFCAKNRKKFRIDEEVLYDLAMEVANSSDKDAILPQIEEVITICIATKK